MSSCINYKNNLNRALQLPIFNMKVWDNELPSAEKGNMLMVLLAKQKKNLNDCLNNKSDDELEELEGMNFQVDNITENNIGSFLLQKQYEKTKKERNVVDAFKKSPLSSKNKAGSGKKRKKNKEKKEKKKKTYKEKEKKKNTYKEKT